MNTSVVGTRDEIWIPLVDEPIGEIVQQLQSEHPEIDGLVQGPHRTLAFRTFAYIRVGLLLGQLLIDNDVAGYDGSETWVDALLRDDRHRDAVVDGAASRRRGDRGRSAVRRGRERGPDDAARERFRTFAREHLG